MADEETTEALPLGSDGQPFCVCEHERQKHSDGQSYCNGFDCGCGLYEPNPRTRRVPAPEQQDPIAEARRLLAEDQQRRMQACNAEIESVLAKHGMRLQISQPTVAIVPAE